MREMELVQASAEPAMKNKPCVFSRYASDTDPLSIHEAYFVISAGDPLKCDAGRVRKFTPRTLITNKSRVRALSLGRSHEKFAETTERFGNKNSWTCRVCSATFPHELQLKSHSRSHPVSCEYCYMRFQLKGELQRHIKQVHMGQRVYFCSHCDVVLKNKISLHDHQVRKHTEGRNYVCHDCGKSFKMKNDLSVHVRNIHGDGREAVCDVCGKTCRNEYVLKRHLKYEHNYSFGCQVCKRKLSTRESLQQHLKLHERKLRCEVCLKLLCNKNTLRQHMRIHADLRPYECTVCDKSFRRQCTYKQHLITHTNARPYVCDVCGQTFTQKPGLLWHRKRHPGPLPPFPNMSIDHVIKHLLNAGKEA
ncbi:PREDICTED: zinc finger protein 761-like [Dinoponera quadriceps]|uniref:Zinc finger protein 761-like n=1 Tax=Dinoponera quadriceps TaxID=609295 RepID=A0A6P3X0P2_DINQU|nr:PREDICTED: zinc finger protein 761-like [Dinoponera quadriceps]